MDSVDKLEPYFGNLSRDTFTAGSRVTLNAVLRYENIVGSAA